MNHSELNDLIALTQVILGDAELGETFRKIIATGDKQRGQYVIALTSILEKRGFAPNLLKALGKLSDPDVVAEIRKLLAKPNRGR